MRISFLVGAALVLAAPAAAQPDASALARSVLEQARRNVAPTVADYLVTLSSGPVRAQLYVARQEDDWEVVEERDAPFADLFEGMLIWPLLADPAMDAAGARYLGRDTVDGRPALALMMRVPGLTLETMEMPDSARVVIDAETRQVLRVTSAADMDPSYGGAMRRGGHVDMELRFGGYESIHGVTLPRTWRIIVRMRTNLTDAERQEMRDQLSGMMGSGTAEEAEQMRLLADVMRAMLDGEPMDLTVRVDDVQANPGRPAWAGDGG